MTLFPDAIRHLHLLPLLLVAFLPILLHILDRRRARTVDWPAMRFLVLGSRSRLRRLKLREALLIAVRSLAALLIAYALLGPTAREERTAAGQAPRTRAIVLAIDASYSMAYRREPEAPSALERAREAALEALEGTGPGSQVFLFTQEDSKRGTRPQPLAPEAARRAIAELAPGGGTFRLVEALDLAAALLAGSSLPALEVHVCTDLQASVLPAAGAPQAPGSDRLRSLRPRPLVRLIDCGDPEAANAFVAAASCEPLARGSGEPIAFTAAIERTGARGGGDPLPVRLIAEGVEVAATEAVPAPDGGMAVKLAHAFPRSPRPEATAQGARAEVPVAIELPPDGLAEDDARRLVVTVFDRLEVLLAGSTLEGTGPGSARFARLALSPRAPAAAEPAAIFHGEFTERLAGADLSRHHAVIVTGIFRLEEPAAERLEGFVRGGGGLLVFAGSGADLASLEERLHRGGRGILPAAFAGFAEEPAGVHPRDVDVSHPALSVFADPEEGDLGRVTVRRFARARPEAGARVLARVGAEWPWLIAGSAGAGKVIVMTTAATPDDSDLPLTPLFLPLLHRLTRHLAAPDPAARSVVAGDRLAVPLGEVAAGFTAHAVDPAGKQLPLEVTVEDGELRAVLAAARTPGFYEVRIAGPKGESRQIHAVNIDPEESRLARASPAAVAAAESALGLEVARDPADFAARRVTVSADVEAWPLAVAAALALLFAEALLARSFARGRAAG